MKSTVALIIVLPFNILRIFYNKILKYKIENTSIGFLTIIISDDCKINESRVHSFNYIKINKIKINKSKFIILIL